MKKLFVFICAVLISIMVHASVLIPLSVEWLPNKPVGNGHPKSPMRPPLVYIEDYTLAFVADHPEYILNIKDEDGEVVYSTVVYSALTQVTLPANLSGDYEIELLMGNWKFTGYIVI